MGLGGMYHSHEVVQYVVTETFGDPSMSVSGAKKSRLKSGVECGGCGGGMSLRVWSGGGGMDHNWVVQYVVIKTFGVPSLLFSG